MAWDPSQYLKFAGPRLQPGLDLIARLPELTPRRIVDLGCGTGQLAALLAQRWPEAETIGLDSDPRMLDEARAACPELRWVAGDIAAWRPDAPVDLIYSNAALRWLDGHAELFPRLVASLAPGGILAVQMPRNFDAPSHALMRAVAAEPHWGGRVALRAEPVGTPAQYYDLLAPLVSSIDLWSTEYLHVLDGDDPVLDWVRGTALLPVLAALRGEELEAFLADYRTRLAEAYPRRPEGRTLFPFQRVFFVARI